MKILLKNIGQLVTWDKKLSQMVINKNMDILISGQFIEAVGSDISKKADRIIDCGHLVVTPGFIDPHTHPVFAELRRDEFEMRVQGMDYEKIAQAGGGILNSVDALRKLSEDELFRLSLPRVRRFLDYGTTTIEAKSGYGLTIEDELKSLRVIRKLNDELPLDLIPTFLGAHEIPSEYRDKRGKYVKLVTDEMIPSVAEEKLAVYCDVFTEKTVFSLEETEKIFQSAMENGLKIRIHSDEFSTIGGTELAASMNAASADHLMKISDNGIKALKKSGTTAVLLPGTTFFLGKKEYAPARKIWDAGINTALATDFNPGSSMTQNLQIIMSIACIYMGLTPLEALQAVTVNSAVSLGIENEKGSVAPGMTADIACLLYTSPSPRDRTRSRMPSSA